MVVYSSAGSSWKRQKGEKRRAELWQFVSASGKSWFSNFSSSGVALEMLGKKGDVEGSYLSAGICVNTVTRLCLSSQQVAGG